MPERIFRPFGDFLPDRRLLSNEGLVRAFGVTPIVGNYIQAPGVECVAGDLGTPGDPLSEEPFGFGLHQQLSGGTRKTFAYYGSETKLYEIDIVDSTPGVLDETDRSRLVGGAYAFTASPPLSTEFWWFVSYGDNVIATNLLDEVQFLTTPGSGNFEDMITSTFKPQGRFAFVIKQNLFLAYCFLPSTYDGIAAGTHQQLVVWSMNDNIQSFGSEAVDPALIGADYQQNVGGDLGPITAGIGGDFGIIFLAGGIVRVDGPPYEFRVIVIGDTTLYPDSVFRLHGDIYFWGQGGPSVLRGGEPPVERLGNGRIQRSLLDNVTLFGQDFSRERSLGIRDISGSCDPVNGLVRFAYDPNLNARVGSDVIAFDTISTATLDISLETGRVGVSRSPKVAGVPRDRFLRLAPSVEGQKWGPFGGVYFLQEAYDFLSSSWRLGRYQIQPGGVSDSGDIELLTGFGRLDDRRLTRILAVRPDWTDSTAITESLMESLVQVRVLSKNKPWGDEFESDIHAEFNADGWIGTDSTVLAAYHAIELIFQASGLALSYIHELEGIEIQYVTGGEYGA